jgi:hypothetical protein
MSGDDAIVELSSIRLDAHSARQVEAAQLGILAIRFLEAHTAWMADARKGGKDMNMSRSVYWLKTRGRSFGGASR